MKSSLTSVLRLGAVSIALLTFFAAMLLLPDMSGGHAALDRVVAVKVPQGIEARSTAVFVTGSDGWTAEHDLRAERLAKLHTLVIGIDGAGLLGDAHGECARLGSLIAPVAHRIQAREGAFASIPVLVALEDGSDLVLNAALAGPSAFKGLITEGFGRGPQLCAGPLIPDAVGGKAPVRWLDVAWPGQPSPTEGLAGSKVVRPTTDHRKAFYRSYLGVAGTDSSFDVQTMSQAPDLSDLPLTIHQNTDAAKTDTYAIFLSGDGGWAKFDKEVADRLAASGIPVVGISSLRYLWREKQPNQIARDFARIDRHYQIAFDRRQVLLVGFSLGANTLPFAAMELSPDLNSRLAGVGMIAPETFTGFEIVTGGWLGRPTGAIEVVGGLEVLAERSPQVRVACLFGSDETASACPDARSPGIRKVAFAGGHHLGHDHDGIARTLLDLAHAGG